MDRKKIKLLIALYGWRIRCRMTYTHDEHNGFKEVQYAWLEDEKGNHYSDVADYAELYRNSFGDTRTQAMNNIVDYWYELNKHTLEK